MIEWAELAVPIIGTAAGWVFQSISESRNQMYTIALGKLEAGDTSADKAQKRGSPWLRWAIVGAILVAAVGSQFVFGWTNDISLEQVREKGGFLWGLIPRREIVEVIPVQGFVILKEYRSAFELAVFFVLGRRAGR